MDLDFSEEQELLRDSVRRICEAHFDNGTVRALEGEADKFHRAFWRVLGTNGICGLRIGEAHGGAQMGALALALVQEEFGRVLASSPFLPSCIHAAGLLGGEGAGPIGAEWLRRIAAGSAVVVPAWVENGLSLGDADPVRIVANGRLSGTKLIVPFASVADALLVRVEQGEQRGWVLVAAGAPGVRIAAQPNQASQPLFEVRFDQAPLVDGLLLPASRPVEGEVAFEDVLIASAAEAVGAGSRLIALTTDYANQREQFGRPIAGFQAISHPLAQCAADLEGARYLTYQAAWAKDAGLPCAHLARIAKYKAAAQYRRLATVSVQVHGGIGYTTEGDPQLYYRRAKYQELMHGTAASLKAAIANHVLA